MGLKELVQEAKKDEAMVVFAVGLDQLCSSTTLSRKAVLGVLAYFVACNLRVTQITREEIFEYIRAEEEGFEAFLKREGWEESYDKLVKDIQNEDEKQRADVR